FQTGRSRSGNYLVDLHTDSIRVSHTLTLDRALSVRAVIEPADLTSMQEPAPGDRLHITATVLPLEGRRNPHDFDYRQYLASKGILLQITVDTLHSLHQDGYRRGWHRIRKGVLSLIDRNFDPPTRPLARALLIGHKEELDPELRIRFSRAGLAHVMAVSGLHVGFIIAPFWLAIPFFWTLRYGRQAGMVLLAGLLLFYAGITGFSESVSRAAITGGFITYGRLFHKARDAKNLTAVSALIILLINPSDLFSIGFQLSFAAVYIILLVLPVLQRMLPPWIRYRWYGKPVMIILVSLIVQVGLYPLLAHYFGEFSLIGPVANALAVPLLGLAVPLGLALLPVAWLFPAAGWWLNIPVRFLVDGLNRFVEQVGSLEWSWITTGPVSPMLFCIWTAAILTIAALHLPRLRWKMVILLLGLLVIGQVKRWIHTTRGPELTVTIFDVGQGDAALIETAGGSTLLIDCGRWTPGYDSGTRVIGPHMKKEGLSHLDAVILTHPHADHIGGILSLMDRVSIDTIYNAGYRYDSQLYRSYRTKADSLGIPVRSVTRGMKIRLDPTVRLFIYAPEPGITVDDPNRRSLVAELVYGHTEFLFTGDAYRKQEDSIVRRYGSLVDTDFLKVGHHGSRTSSSRPFLKRAGADIAVVSVAERNRYGHPHPEVLHRLRTSVAELYLTSRDRALIFRSDGRRIRNISW
ncbi:MAG: DNA internalization-related competence protein ComEC/Rec2, partial [Balneolaceae bacterium]|nr:DNA internalization-related competence protein ComEC/Rec2 [Balneolaceae bacterium]